MLLAIGAQSRNRKERPQQLPKNLTVSMQFGVPAVGEYGGLWNSRRSALVLEFLLEIQ